jgi:hypothetical protein
MIPKFEKWARQLLRKPQEELKRHHGDKEMLA